MCSGLEVKEGDSLDYLESPVSDGTIEENFEEELSHAPVLAAAAAELLPPPPSRRRGQAGQEDEEEDDNNDFSDIAKYEIVEVVGNDSIGRKVIVVSACKLPSNREFNHDRFLR